MPEITFLGDEFPHLSQWECIASIMFFPNDLVKQQAFGAKCQYERMCDLGLLTSQSEKKLREIIDAAFMSEPVSEEMILKASIKGFLAGVQLYICLMLHDKNEQSGLKRSRSIINENKVSFFGGQPLVTASISSLERIWKTYYSVSHLWAAMIVCKGREDVVVPNEEVYEFILISNGIGNLVVNCFPDSKTPILNPNDLFFYTDDVIGSWDIEFIDIPEIIKISSLNYSDIKREIRKAEGSA